MKKVFSLFVVIILTCVSSLCLAEQLSFAEYSTDELYMILNQLKSEISSRTESQDEIMVIDFNSPEVTLVIHSWEFVDSRNSFIYVGDGISLEFQCSIYNNSNIDVEVGVDEEYINGWMVLEPNFYDSIVTIPAGRKARASFSVDGLFDKANVSKKEDLVDFEGRFFVQEDGNYRADKITRQRQIILN